MRLAVHRAFCQGLTILALISIHCSKASAQDREVCIERDAHRSLDACTRLIGTGQLAGKDLGTIYVIRATLLRAEGSYDQAISDITRAIELFKSSASSGIVASAYVTRGSFYALSGDKEKALDDYKHALVLDAANPQAAEGVAQTEAAIKAASIPSGPAPERPSTLAPVHGGKEVQTEHKKVPTEEIPGRDTLVQECLAAYVRVHGAFRAEGQSDATYKSRSDMTSMCNSAISQGNYYWRVYKTTRSANPARQLSCCRANLHSRGMTGDVSSECKRLSEVDWCKLQQQY